MANAKIDKPKIVKKKQWLLSHTYLIALIEKYPVTYYPFATKKPTKAIKAKWNNAWIEIGKQLSQPIKTCKMVWSDIKYRYAKLMNLINSGKITKETALSNPETGRYFDGLLSFMDPYIEDVTDEDIPYRIHKSYNELFGLQTKRSLNDTDPEKNTQFVTHGQLQALIAERELTEGPSLDSIDTQYLQNVVDGAIKRKLMDLLSINNTLSNQNQTLSIPSKNNESFNLTTASTKTIPETIKRKPSLGLQTELIIEDDIKNEPEVDGIEENVTLDKNEETDIESKTQIVIPTDNSNSVIIEDNTSDVAMTGNKSEALCDDYIKHFFKELGEVMSVELSLYKQSILRSRINKLLKELLLQSE